MYTIELSNGRETDTYERDTLEGKDVESLAEYLADDEFSPEPHVASIERYTDGVYISVSNAKLLKFESALINKVSEIQEAWKDTAEHNRLESMK